MDEEQIEFHMKKMPLDKFKKIDFHLRKEGDRLLMDFLKSYTFNGDILDITWEIVYNND